MNYNEVIKKLESLFDSKNAAGMARFGITAKKVYGISMPKLRELAKEIGKDHELAKKLWKHESRETRILASLIENLSTFTEQHMESWVREFDSWEACDQCCMNLFWKHPLAYKKAMEWTTREREYEKRAGFALIAVLAWKDKLAEDAVFHKFFALIKQGATDDRPMVKKAVNWALRQIGKRNPALRKKAITVAEEIQKMNSKSANWVANDALRELRSN